MYHTAWTDIWIPALREVDLEPSAKEGAKRIEALVSLYWSSRSLHLKSLLTQSHKSQPRKNLSDRLELEESLAKSLNSMLFSISKTKKQGQLMPMTGVISGVKQKKGGVNRYCPNITMETIFMNIENTKRNVPHKFVLNLSQRLDLIRY